MFKTLIITLALVSQATAFAPQAIPSTMTSSSLSSSYNAADYKEAVGSLPPLGFWYVCDLA